MKKIVLSLLIIASVLLSVAVATKAAFEDKGEIKGTTFKVGNADVKLVNDLSSDVSDSNLVDVKDGPVFSGIFPGWSRDYGVKLYNNGSLNIALESESEYTTAEDPDSLRESINVEVFNWNDSNENGIAETSEVENVPLAPKKNIIKWKSEGISLGELKAGEIKGLLLKFSVESISSTKQSKSAKYNFVFTGTTDGVTQD